MSPQPKESFTIHEDDPRLTSCGAGHWRPQWLQHFANPIVFLINLCIVNICQLMTASIFYGTMSTLEKRYSYNSKISALIMVSDLFLSMLLSPIVGYYALRFNRSRLIAIGSLFLGFACLFTASPYFIYGSAQYQLESGSGHDSNASNYLNFDLCTAEKTSECSDDGEGSSSTVWPAVIILFFGNFFRGIGFTIYYTLAMPFIDDSVPKRDSPFYLSIMHGVNLIGRLLGYFVSAYFLSFAEDPWADAALEPKDPRFLGAWWLGFFVTGILVIVTSLPLFFFPSEFKSANIRTVEIEVRLKEKGSSFGQSLMRLVKNPILIIYFLGNEFRYIGLNGFYAFMAKYIESQYRTSSSQSSAIAGATGFAPVSIGLLIGGAYVSYFRPKARMLFTLVFLAELVSVFTIGSGLFLGCEPIRLEGMEAEDGFNLQTSCNVNCDCTTRVYSPVCGPDLKTTYFSPCHAGCEGYNATTLSFEHCSCLQGPATSGYCKADLNCEQMSTYLVLLTLGTLISATAKTGNSLITFRSVDPVDKSFTNGVLSALLSVLALHQLNTGHICYTKPLEPEEDEPMEVIEDDVNVASTSGGPKDTADEQSKAVASVSTTKLITESVELMELGEEHDDHLDKTDELQQQQPSTSDGPKDSGPSKPQMASSSSLSPPPIKPKRVKTSLIFDAEQPSTSSGNTGASKAVIKRFLTREAKASAPVAPKMPSKRATAPVTVDPPPSTTTEEEDRWICHYCSKTYATLPLLAKHQQNWPGIHLTCIYCGRLVLQADLEAHLGEFHGTSSKKPLKK